MELLRVSAQSNPKSVAGAIASQLRTDGKVEVQSIGASAINQAVKAIIIARGYIATNGLDLSCIPSFVKVQIEGEERTAIRCLIEAKSQ